MLTDKLRYRQEANMLGGYKVMVTSMIIRLSLLTSNTATIS